MKNSLIVILILLISLSSNIFSQTFFRKAIFLSRSVGSHIYDHPGANTNVPSEIDKYNFSNDFKGIEAVSMDKVLFPIKAYDGLVDNSWYEWHRIFDKVNTEDDIYLYLDDSTYSIIIIKICIPSSDIKTIGSPSDSTIDYTGRNLEVYKWHIRSIVKIMEQYRNKFFCIWTLAPNLEGETTALWASYAHWFSSWMKDTLATGLDTIYGKFPPNIYIFDYFHLLDSSYYLPVSLADAVDDPHPNARASEIAAPHFVKEVFDAAIAYEGLTPVELSLFNGAYSNGVVKLKWITETEKNNFGFEIQRKSDYSNYETIGFINGNGSTTNRITYYFVDDKLRLKRYYYRLKQMDMDGSIHYSEEIVIDIFDLNKFYLEQNYPNPFNPSTEINYYLPKSENISLKVYDHLGSVVAILENGFQTTGKHTLIFNTQGLSSGIYFYRMEANNFTSTRKMLLIK